MFANLLCAAFKPLKLKQFRDTCNGGSCRGFPEGPRCLRAVGGTVRCSGDCADPWTREDAEVAARLLQGLQAVGDDRRRRQGKQGDDDAWLWEEETPCLATLMLEQVARVVSGMSAAEGERVQKVGERLLGP